MLTEYFTCDEFVFCCDIMNSPKVEKRAFKKYLLENVKHWKRTAKEEGVDLEVWTKKIENIPPKIKNELYKKIYEFWDVQEDSVDCDERLEEIGLTWS